MSKLLCRILLADDHPLVLLGLSKILERVPGLKIVAQCQDGEAALSEIRARRPDVALIDLHLPKLDGFRILAAVRDEQIPTKPIVLTASMNDQEIRVLVSSGAQGLILKEAAPEALLQSIREVADGKQWFQPDLVGPALERELSRLRRGAELVKPLTPREAELTLLVGATLSNKEIAIKLSLAEGTVKIHLNNIYRKLDIRKRTELVQLARSCSESLSQLAKLS